jgi:hypothetical protein
MNKSDIENELSGDSFANADDKFDEFLQNINKIVESDNSIDERYEEFCRQEMIALNG